MLAEASSLPASKRRQELVYIIKACGVFGSQGEDDYQLRRHELEQFPVRLVAAHSHTCVSLESFSTRVNYTRSRGREWAGSTFRTAACCLGLPATAYRTFQWL